MEGVLKDAGMKLVCPSKKLAREATYKWSIAEIQMEITIFAFHRTGNIPSINDAGGCRWVRLRPHTSKEFETK